ncbi:MAG: restriction endonuclease subunit S, partial [Acidobacteriota bacterium]
MRWKRYAQYKYSHIGWLGIIPDEWVVKRIKYLGQITYGLGEPPERSDDGLPFVRATDIYRGKIKSEGMQRVNPSDVPWSRNPSLKAKDILVVRSGAYTGDSAIVPEELDGAIAGYDMVLRITGNRPEFIAHTLLSKYILEAQLMLKSMRAAQPHLNAEELGATLILTPPVSEQQTIADFLDRETERIDSLIAKKQRQIELLNEKRAALISHAVTKGLNPHAKMKDSGSPFWGEIPAHWTMKQLRHLTPNNRQIMYGIILPGPNYEGGVPIVKGGNCEPGRLCLDKMSCTTPEIDAAHSKSRLNAGDIVYAIRGSIGSAELVPEELAGANLTQDAARVSPRSEVYRQWLLYAVRSRAFFGRLDSRAT